MQFKRKGFDLYNVMCVVTGIFIFVVAGLVLLPTETTNIREADAPPAHLTGGPQAIPVLTPWPQSELDGPIFPPAFVLSLEVIGDENCDDTNLDVNLDAPESFNDAGNDCDETDEENVSLFYYPGFLEDPVTDMNH